MVAEQKQPDYPRHARNLIAIAGFALICAGSFAADWRVGCIASGVLLLTGGVAGMAITAKAGAGRKR